MVDAAEMLPSRIVAKWPEINNGYTFTEQYLSRKHKTGSTNVLDYYTTKHSDTGSPEQWLARVQAGQVMINGTVARPEQDLKHGDQLAYHRQPWYEADSPNYITILFEDDHLDLATMLSLRRFIIPDDVLPSSSVQLLTPSGSAQPQATPSSSDCTRVSGHSQPKRSDSHARVVDKQHDLATPAPVHRLGKGTSGLLLCAKSEVAKRRLADVMTHTTQISDNSAAEGAAKIPECKVPEEQQHARVQESILQQQTGLLRDAHPLHDQPRPRVASWWPRPAPPSCTVLHDNELSSSQLPVGAVRKLYRTRVQGIVRDDDGQVDVPIGKIDHPGVRGGLWAACLDSCSAGKDTSSLSITCGSSHGAVNEAENAATSASFDVDKNNNHSNNHKSCDSSRQAGGEIATACPVTTHLESRCHAAGSGNAAVGNATTGAAKGKPSRSRWICVHRDTGSGSSLLDVEIFTGRPHQIRIHMAAIGHPLVGDPLYGPGGVPYQQQHTRSHSHKTCSQAPQAPQCVGHIVHDDRAHAHLGSCQSGSVFSAHQAQQESKESTCLHDSPCKQGDNGSHDLELSTVKNQHTPCMEDPKPANVAPGDCGYHLHAWQLLLRHPVYEDTVLHLVAPLPTELRAPWEVE